MVFGFDEEIESLLGAAESEIPIVQINSQLSKLDVGEKQRFSVQIDLDILSIFSPKLDFQSKKNPRKKN